MSAMQFAFNEEFLSQPHMHATGRKPPKYVWVDVQIRARDITNDADCACERRYCVLLDRLPQWLREVHENRMKTQGLYVPVVCACMGRIIE